MLAVLGLDLEPLSVADLLELADELEDLEARIDVELNKKILASK